jgi:hypothetical protein
LGEKGLTMNALVTQNEFNNALVPQGIETASSAVAAQAKAMIEARYIMAIRRPRDMDVVREKMLKECKRPSFAAVARYQKPIGRDQSKWPTGPSIRFAESAIRNMTNITVEVMTVYDDREKRIVRVTVTDLEANVPYFQDVTITKTIERRQSKDGDTVLRTRTNSYGDTLYILEATDDDIINKQQALISKAMRTIGLRLIPGDIVDECMEAVIETQRNADAEDPDAAKRKLFDAFGQLGVRAEQIKDYLGHDAATLAPKELTELRALYAAIRDGEATWRDVMEAKGGADAKAADAKTTTLKDIAAKASKKKPADPGAGLYPALMERLNAAADREAADAILQEGLSLPQDQYAGLEALFAERFPAA